MSGGDPGYDRLLSEALQAIQSLKSEVARLQSATREPIAVIGIGCRFPGNVASPEDFWRLLEHGSDAVLEIPADRWDNDAYYDPDPDTPGGICTRFGGFLPSKDAFDPRFFRISPREAMYMDPQQRLLLEIAWEAAEHAGIPPDALYGGDTGVFVGVSTWDYSLLTMGRTPEADLHRNLGTGNALSAVAGRISYVLGLKGPSLALDTACSSSLVAVHAACESLRRRECGAAFAGGVNMILSPHFHLISSRARMLAPDGRCKAFDDSANGYVRSEGAGIVLLKRLSDAVADEDNVLAVIRGGAVNQDGASGGLTVPNGVAQQQLVRTALANAGVDAADVGYVEAHGTGTPLGDPIELEALGEVFRHSHSRARPLSVGSVKTNLGHMEAASGIGGLIKVVLQLQKGTLVPHLHLARPSSRIRWAELPIAIPTALQPWPSTGAKKRVAGVSSFGFTGTNAHVVVEEAPAPIARCPDRPERPRHVLALSAKSDAALVELAGAYAQLLGSRPEWTAGDVGYSANAGRSHFKHRLAVVARSAPDLRHKLAAFERGEHLAGVFRGSPAAGHVRIAFLFSGEGLQYAGMGRELYESQPLVAEILRRCDRSVRQRSGWSLLDRLFASNGDGGFHQSSRAAPLLVALEYALACLWQSWGVRPSVVTGDGIGEYAAAAVADVFSIEDALHLAASASGDLPALCRTAAVPRDPARMDVVSGITADLIARETLRDAEYWLRQRVAPGRVLAAIDAVRRLGCTAFLEVGPAPTLTDRCRESVDPTLPWLASLAPGRSDWDQVLHGVAEMYVHGVVVDWEAFDRGYGRRRLAVPTYRFQRQRYWYEKASGFGPRASGPSPATHGLIPEAALIPEA
jgi:myxalamid-type polyketide synthase MxaB